MQRNFVPIAWLALLLVACSGLNPTQDRETRQYDPPRIVSISPLQGKPGSIVRFSAIVENGANYWHWQFGAGASPSTSYEASPVVTLGSEGRYACQLVVRGTYGSDLENFTLFISEGGTPTWHNVRLSDPGFAHNSSLALIGGRPAVAYDQIDLNHDPVAAEVKYIRAMDLYGADWGLRTLVGSVGTEDYPKQLALLGGKPALLMAPTIGSAPGLYFVTSKDSLGGSWNRISPVQVPEGPSNPTWVVADGKPAIAYKAQLPDLSFGLQFIRANNAEGSGWPPEARTILKGTNGWGGGYQTTMTLIDGKPAIALSIRSGVSYMHALDQQGNAWSTPVQIDSAFVDECSLSIASVEGRPAVAYVKNSTNMRLRYAIATEPSGQNWTAQTLFFDERTAYPSLAVINGNPAVAFYGFDSYNVIYLPALDKVGTTWGKPEVASTEGALRLQLADINGAPAIVSDTSAEGWDNYGYVVYSARY